MFERVRAQGTRTRTEYKNTKILWMMNVEVRLVPLLLLLCLWIALQRDVDCMTSSLAWTTVVDPRSFERLYLSHKARSAATKSNVNLLQKTHSPHNVCRISNEDSFADSVGKTEDYPQSVKEHVHCLSLEFTAELKQIIKGTRTPLITKKCFKVMLK